MNIKRLNYHNWHVKCNIIIMAINNVRCIFIIFNKLIVNTMSRIRICLLSLSYVKILFRNTYHKKRIKSLSGISSGMNLYLCKFK